MGKYRRKNRGSRVVLYAGGIALFICICLCIAVFLYLKREYRMVACREFSDQHVSAGEELGRQVLGLANDMRGGVRDIGGMTESNLEKRIRYFANAVVKREAFSHVFYVSYDGKYYADDSALVPENSDTIHEACKVFEELDYYQDGVYVGMMLPLIDPDVRRIMIVTRVYRNDKVRGYAVGIVDTDRLFDSPLFDYQKSRGKCFVVDSMGKIMSQTAALSGSHGDSFKEGVLEQCRDSEENRNALSGIKYALTKGESGYIMVKTLEGLDMQINFSPVRGVPELSYLCAYTPGFQDEMFRPMLFWSVLACIFIMVLMIICMLMVWANAKRINMTVEKLAYEDPVTKGKNLSYFKEFALERIMNSPEKEYAIYRFDISNFRYINESYGHIRADHILESCIRNFTQIFTDEEICVRMNSDQFLALVINDATLEKRKNEFRAAVNADSRGRNIKYPIRFKTGIYFVKKNDHDIDTMIDHANVARKSVSRDTKDLEATYSEKIVDNMRKIDRIESLMHKALTELEFKVYLQPKWDIVNDRVCGAEALVRWCRPDGTIIPPDSFIPIFENNGFVEQLDFYMLESVCSILKDTIAKGGSVHPVSVNQSRLLLHSPDYVDNVANIIKEYDISPELIELEITETVFENGREDMIRIVKELKKLGVRVSMDDFGSGYSSLNMLKDVPFDVIKIDREFFAGAADNAEAGVILRKIVDMVNELGRQVVCEGVENAGQVELLKNMGCSCVQGYFYSKPIPAPEFIERYFRS
ncbi:MAG: GGDEF domain-containing phosphodiesterase [Lachnospiraceae bacterium]|nr:GGDEF domain-containing phosphodiesterase [Lachnospiraceae bacterium]